MNSPMMARLYEAVGVGAVFGLVSYLVLHAFGQVTGLCR